MIIEQVSALGTGVMKIVENRSFSVGNGCFFSQSLCGFGKTLTLVKTLKYLLYEIIKYPLKV